jgi:hypothetical protein
MATVPGERATSTREKLKPGWIRSPSKTPFQVLPSDCAKVMYRGGSPRRAPMREVWPRGPVAASAYSASGDSTRVTFQRRCRQTYLPTQGRRRLWACCGVHSAEGGWGAERPGHESLHVFTRNTVHPCLGCRVPGPMCANERRRRHRRFDPGCLRIEDTRTNRPPPPVSRRCATAWVPR